MENWIQTFTGRKFDYKELPWSGIDIMDIAHALSNIPRYSGHVKYHYSVAQHSILVSSIVPDHLALQALLHDAAEAYIGDLPTPAKCLIPEYNELEEKIIQAIFDKYGVQYPISEVVHLADKKVLLAERYSLFDQVIEWNYYKDIIPARVAIVQISNSAAESLFLHRWDQLALYGGEK